MMEERPSGLADNGRERLADGAEVSATHPGYDRGMEGHTLSTARCRLRALTREDGHHVVSACATPGFTDGMTWDPVTTFEDTFAFTDEALASWEKGEKFVWTVEDARDGSFIGRVDVRPAPELPGNVWGLGYWIHPTKQGNGYATEAAAEALRFAFDVLHADAIVSSHHDWNLASGRVLSKIGMRHTGFSEGRTTKNGKPVRAAEYWLDRGDWRPEGASA